MKALYTPYKIFHFPEKLHSLPREGVATTAPLHIRIKPTNLCGHHCWYCAYKAKDLDLGAEMVERDQIPPEKMREIVSDMETIGVRAVTFSGGGDPFYYKPILETVKRLADGPIRFASLTNGARLSGEIADVFAHHGTWLRVSMDGWDDASYSRYRGVRLGDYTKLMENLLAFKRLGGSCHLGVSLIVDRDNACYVEESVKRLQDIGVNSVKVSPCITSNDGNVSNQYHKPIFSAVRTQLEKLRAGLVNDYFELFDSYHELDEKFDKSYDWCPYLQVLCVIGADQKVYSCQDKAYTPEGLLGSLENQSFSEFWFKDKEKFFRIDPRRDCRHHCVANKKNHMLADYFSANLDHLFFV
ncbi:MAG: radical SAM protein [Proteobacteria bacterium]|jgi:MoaA/NifB/PqqE/SkfB family radical SAM enzyme|nr:radical SAM protein [Pseudomonadota bacterium]MBT5818642.1 radical SAM protein [Pseudomonadota bacterium]MBT6350105.1 radical SAM protein [Pseudomonadota bacterium]